MQQIIETILTIMLIPMMAIVMWALIEVLIDVRNRRNK